MTLESRAELEETGLHPRVIEDILLWEKSMTGRLDNASKVLRLHALTEHYLDRILSFHLRDASVILNDGRFTYHQKRLIVQALGALPSNVVESLKRLTALRNKCAHKLQPDITTSDILHAAEPIEGAFKTTRDDYANDGVEIDDFRAYSWAIFTEISLRLTPYEVEFSKPEIPNKQD